MRWQIPRNFRRAPIAEQMTLAYCLFTIRRWAGASWSKAAAWAVGLVWRNARNDRRARLDRRAAVERAARQRP